MKNFIISCGLVLLAWCSQPIEYTIDFCTNLNSDIECESNSNSFKVGDRVYVLFECNQPFKEKTITGKIYAIESTGSIPLGSQDWKINPGDSYAYDHVDCHESGTFRFEFLNEEGQVLATNQLEVN